MEDIISVIDGRPEIASDVLLVSDNLNIFNECWEKFRSKEYPKPACKIQALEKRWGSLSKAGTLSLNVQLIKTPKECIEYVIIHELCHLVYHNHSRDFFKLLEASLPDWIERKYKLEMSLI